MFLFLVSFFFLVFIFKINFNLFEKLILFSFMFQVGVLIAILEISNLVILLMEVWVIFSFLWSFEKDNFSFIWVCILMMISLMLTFLIMGNKGNNFMVVFYFFLIFKFCFSSFLMYLHEESFLFKMSFNLIFYLFNSKIMVLYYGITLSNLECSGILFDGMFNSLSLFLMLTVWLCLIFMSCSFLFFKDMQGYMCSSLCLSQFTVMFSGLCSYSVFYLCFFIDLIMLFLIFYCIFLNMDFVYSLLNDGPFFSIILFMISCQILGIPPFPSFYVEVVFLFSMYFSFMSWVNFLFFLLIYMFMTLHFILVLSILNSSSQNIISEFISSPSKVISIFSVITQTYSSLWVWITVFGFYLFI